MSYLHIKFWHYSALTLASLYQKLFEDGLHPRTPTSSPFGLFEVKKKPGTSRVNIDILHTIILCSA